MTDPDALFVPEKIDHELHTLCRIYGDDIITLIRHYYGKQGKWSDLGHLGSPEGAQGLCSILSTLRLIIEQAIREMNESADSRRFAAGRNKKL